MSRRHPDQHPHRDDPASYSLDELSREAGVTPRTIRYYIAEGLLPPPDAIGRNARYSQDHLDRLRLIAQLKDEFLPLKEIRTRLTTLSDEEIRDAVSNTERVAAMESRMPPRESSAEQYLARALKESPAPYAARARQGMSRRAMTPDLAAGRSWKRIPIAPDAELLITDDAWDRRGEKIQSAINWIRRMLNE